MLKIFRHEGAGLILYNSGHQVTMCKKYSFQRPIFYNTGGGGHPGQTGLAIIAIWSEEPLLRLLEFHNLLRPKLVVRKLVVENLHGPRCIERSGKHKQEGFKSNLVIIKYKTDIQISPLKARQDWCTCSSLVFSTILGFENTTSRRPSAASRVIDKGQAQETLRHGKDHIRSRRLYAQALQDWKTQTVTL